MTNDRTLCWLNRILVTLISFAILALAVCAMILPVETLRFVQAAAVIGPALLDGTVPIGMGRAVPGPAIVSFVAFLVLLFEIWPRRSTPRLIVPIDAGAAEYPASLVANAIADQIQALPGVSTARVEVQNQRNKVNVLVRLWLDNTPDLQDVITQVANRVREKVRSLGFEPGTIRVAVQTEPVDLSHRIKPLAGSVSH